MIFKDIEYSFSNEIQNIPFNFFKNLSTWSVVFFITHNADRGEVRFNPRFTSSYRHLSRPTDVSRVLSSYRPLSLRLYLNTSLSSSLPIDSDAAALVALSRFLTFLSEHAHKL